MSLSTKKRWSYGIGVIGIAAIGGTLVGIRHHETVPGDTAASLVSGVFQPLLPESNTGHVEALRVDMYSIEDLVSVAGVIVEGVLVSERPVEIEVPSVVGGAAIQRSEIVRTFRVDAPLKGSVDGSHVEVWSTTSVLFPRIEDVPGAELNTDVPRFAGERYLLFLVETAEWDGSKRLSHFEPAGARLVGEDLTFIVTTEYSEHLGRRFPEHAGRTVPPALEGLTRADVIEAISK